MNAVDYIVAMRAAEIAREVIETEVIAYSDRRRCQPWFDAVWLMAAADDPGELMELIQRAEEKLWGRQTMTAGGAL